MTDLFSSEADPASITFDSLVGDGKKFKTPDDLAKAKSESDNFIEQLKTEAANLRTELRSRTNLEELVTRLTPSSPPSSQTPPTQLREVNPESKPQEAPLDLKSEVAKLLAEEKSKTSRDTNLATARQGLKERFGADYNQALKDVALELGVSEDFLTSTAATSPVALLKLVDSVKVRDSRAPTTPPLSNDRGPTPSASGRKNKAYFDALRKADINNFLSPKVQQEYYKESMSQGPRFFE